MTGDMQDFMDELNSDTADFSQRVVQNANERNRNVIQREQPRIEVESNTLSSGEGKSKLIPSPTRPQEETHCRLWYSNPVTYG